MLLNNEPPIDVERIETIMQTIDLYSECLVRFGSSVQEKVATLADSILQSTVVLNPEVIDKILLEINDLINELNVTTSNKSLLSVFRSAKEKERRTKAKALDERGRELTGQAMKVCVNLEILENHYRQNLEYHAELECQILAGKQKLKTVRESELKQLQSRAAATETLEDIAACNYLQGQIKTLEERIQSLETTKVMSAQMTTQIRWMQNSNAELLQRIRDGSRLIAMWKQSTAIDANR